MGEDGENERTIGFSILFQQEEMADWSILIGKSAKGCLQCLGTLIRLFFSGTSVENLLNLL